MLPRQEAYGPWPASGEIDIMESRGNDNLLNDNGESMGNDHMSATLHWGPYTLANKWQYFTTTR